MPALRRNPKDQVESETLNQEAVSWKLPWRLKDVKDARAMGHMLRKAANGVETAPGESSLLQSTKMKKEWKSEDCFDISLGDAEFGVCPACFLPCFGDYS